MKSIETEKLYYIDPYIKEFSATVLSCEPTKDGFCVVLDRTAFYPEGGGQPADHGKLGTSAVRDVQEKDGVVFHICENKVEVGETCACQIDWARRFDHMQQHSGEHIISGILCREYHCDNVGFHMGADMVTIDYNTEISWEQALEAEHKANAVVWSDCGVEITLPDREALAALEYRSKKELTGQVRIVTFPNADCCACCGTHVTRAGQVGLIKVLSVQKFREGVRMEILCGKRALDYLGKTFDQAKAIGQKLSVKPQDALSAVERMESELAAVKYRAAEMESALFEAIAKEHEHAGDVLLFQNTMKGDSVRRLADTVAHRCRGLACVFSGEDGQYAYAMVRSDAQDIAPLVKEMNRALNGRGGGRNGFAQGSVQADRSAIQAFFKS